MGKQQTQSAGDHAWNVFDVVGLLLGALAVWAWKKAGHGSDPRGETAATGGPKADDGTAATGGPKADDGTARGTDLEPFTPRRILLAKILTGALGVLAAILALAGSGLMVVAVQGMIAAIGSTDGVDDGTVLAAAIALATVQLAFSVAHEYRQVVWFVMNFLAGLFALAALYLGITGLDDGTPAFDANAWSVGMTAAALALIVIVFVADAFGQAENVWLWNFKPEWRTAARPSRRKLRKRRKAKDAATRSAPQMP